MRLRSSAMGADFPPERFLRTPVSTITWLLRELDDQEKTQANIRSITTAQLTNLVLQVAHGLAGSKQAAPKTTLETFLPFPGFVPQGAQPDGPDQPTKFVLSELVRGFRIPMHVFSALVKPAEGRPYHTKDE